MTSELIDRIFDELDYRKLGEIYCDDGGDAFWRAHRGPARELGGRWARALGTRLAPGGRSLYVGAGVAEIPALVHEVRALGREVAAANLRADECAVLNAAFERQGLDELRIEPIEAAWVADRGPFDHACLCSVLTDPELWPVVSGVTYGRLPPVLLDVDAFCAERERIEALVARVLGALELPAVVTTTVDEVPWILHWAERHGVRVDADEETIETAIVGDPLGFLRLAASG